MTNSEQKKIFARNLDRLVTRSGHTRKEVSDALGFNYKTFSGWCNGLSMPTAGKIQLIADYFHVGKSELVDPKSEKTDTQPATVGWYLTPETAEIAQEIFQNPKLRVLFDSARDASPEDLATVQAMLEALLRKERKDD